MNPFDLPGPQFLALYAMLGILIVWAVHYLKQKAEAGEPGRLPVSDPYVIAYLRGGAEETVRLSVAVLVDRKLLAIGAEDTVTTREGVTPMHGSNDLERAILEECRTTAKHPSDLVSSERLQGVARRLNEPTLLHMKLLADTDVRARRWREAGLAIVVLAVVAVIKIAVGVSRNRPVSFLVVLAIAFCAVTAVLTRGARTVRGDRILGDLRVLFDALRDRATGLRPYTSTNELALLMAVFGFGAVPALAFPFARAFRPKRSERSESSCGGSVSSSGSSSSGSSCGGGGSSCGGGGGGCGGCGGS